MKSQKLRFTGADGAQLAARLELPIDGRPLAFAIFAHCFTCTKNLNAVGNISRALSREGIAVLRFDFTGLGESEGDFADTNFSSNVADLLAAAAFLEADYQAPQILIGHSLGGAAVLQAAGQLASVKAVATIGAPSDPAHVKHLLRCSLESIEERGIADVEIAGRSFTLKKQFLDDLEDTRMRESIRNLGAALLVLHAPLDETVGIDNAGEIFTAAKHPKSFISLDRADHLLSAQRDSLYAGSVIASWSASYIDAPISVPERGAKDNLVVTRTGSSSYTTEIRANGHSLIADEPASVGGRDLGPTPYEFLSAALGACTSMTLRMYADRKQWPLEAVEVSLRHEKVHANDCADCESKDVKVDVITREIELIGDLDAAQRQRLLEIADRCPVHRTLHAEVVVRTSLKE